MHAKLQFASVIFYRRSKAFDSLCLLLYTVMPSLNKISYLILSYREDSPIMLAVKECEILPQYPVLVQI